MNDAVIGFLTCLPGAEQEKKKIKKSNKKNYFLKNKISVIFY
jgi:hypothetical protein